jgi:uncharacterized sodium:solute symporter family permease YidK
MKELIPWCIVTFLLVGGIFLNKFFHIGDDVNIIQRNQIIIVVLCLGSLVKTILVFLGLLESL